MSVLVRCCICYGQVSSAADRCPHCGEPNFTLEKQALAKELNEKPDILSLKKQDDSPILKRLRLDNIKIYGCPNCGSIVNIEYGDIIDGKQSIAVTCSSDEEKYICDFRYKESLPVENGNV